jgi:hypothetical protein
VAGGAARIGIFWLLKDKDPKTLFSSDGLLGEMKKAFAEPLLNAEMDPAMTENESLELSIPTTTFAAVNVEFCRGSLLVFAAKCSPEQHLVLPQQQTPFLAHNECLRNPRYPSPP